MDRSLVTSGLTILVALSLAAAAWTFPRVRPPAALGRTNRVLAIACHPLGQLFVVCGLLLINQILCDAYILRAHHGDPSFVARYLGPGWFDIERGPEVQRVAAAIGDGHWLSPTVLRVQAFLELPFALFAYLAVARLLGRDVHRLLVRPLPLAAAALSFTGAFCLIELWLVNPWTLQDLALRAASAIATPLWVLAASWLEGDAPGEARPSGLVGLGAFLAGAAAIALLVLGVYDAFLLYNLAHLRAHAPLLAGACCVAIAAAWAAPRVDRVFAHRDSEPNAAMQAVAFALEQLTLAFFVPSLALRYAGGQRIALVGGLAIIAFGAWHGVTYLRARSATWLPRTAVAAVIGVLGGVAPQALLGAHALPEARLACFALGCLASTIVALRVTYCAAWTPSRSTSRGPIGAFATSAAAAQPAAKATASGSTRGAGSS